MHTQNQKPQQAFSGRWNRGSIRLGLLLLFLFLPMTCCHVHAGSQIWVLYRSKIPLFQAIGEHLAKTSERVVLCPLEVTANAFFESRPPNCMIALGEAAIQRALRTPWDVPIIGAFAGTVSTESRLKHLDVSIPTGRVLEILSRVAPQRNEILFPYISDTAAPDSSVSAAVTQSSRRLIVDKLIEPQLWPSFFEKMRSSARAVLLPVDPRLLNQAFFQTLLLESFRSQTPVIGISEAQVRQGALFALVLTPEKVARSILQFADDIQIQSSSTGLKTRTFSDWDLILNRTIAGKFNLTVPRDLLETARTIF